MLVLITFVLVFFVLADLIPIYINKQWRLFWVYSAMMLFVYVLIIFMALGIKIPSPAIQIKNLISTILGIK